MSLINFGNLANERPDLGQVWTFLDGWIQEHPRVDAIEIGRLARAGKAIDASELAEALTYLVDMGLVREVFRVVDLDGTLLGEDYATPEDVPSTVLNRGREHRITTAETDIVPVYRLSQVNERW